MVEKERGLLYFMWKIWQWRFFLFVRQDFQKQNGIRPLTLQSWMESQSGRTKQNNRWYGKVDVKRAWWQKRACLNLTGNWPHGSQYYSSVSAVEWHKTKRSMDRQKACDFTSEDIRLQSWCPSSEGEEDRMTKVSKKMTLLGVKMIRLIHFIHLNNCSVWFQEMQYN